MGAARILGEPAARSLPHPPHPTHTSRDLSPLLSLLSPRLVERASNARLPRAPPRQVLLGNSPSIDLMGIAVGHIYYFLEDVFPNTPGGRGRRPLATPSVLRTLLSLVTSQDADRYGAVNASDEVEIQPLAQEEEEN